MIYLKTYCLPLFFMLLLAFAFVLPQVYAPASIQFKSACNASVNNNQASTLNCTLNGTGNGDAFVISIYGVGAFNSFTVTDSQLNTYTQRASSITGIGSGASTYIVTTLSGSPSATDTVTVATGGPTRIYAFVASDYSGVTSFGKNGVTQNDAVPSTGTTTSTVSLTGTLGSSTIIDDVAVSYNTGSSLSLTSSNGQTIRDSAIGGFTTCWNLAGSASGCRASDNTQPVNGWSFSASGVICPCSSSQSDLELQGGTSLSTTSISQCYGNCGNPPITLVNTNSTHSINFNQSITLFYKFQSNLNGLVNNITTNVGKTYSNSLTMQIGLYLVANCPLGTDPFTVNCPGSLQRLTSFFNPVKGRNTLTIGNVVVITGQWIGISVTSTFSGLDLNDTNTNVNVFQTNGMLPQIIQSSTQLTSCTCKMGLWSWITGNVIIGPGPSNPPTLPSNCGNGIGDYLTCLTLTFCTGSSNAGCQLAGGLFWSIIYSVFGIVALMWTEHKFLGNSADSVRIPGSVYAFIPLGIQFMFISLGILPAWWGLFIIMVFTVLFTWILLGFARGSGGRPS